MSKPTLITGIRASGDIHLGNYLGAIQPAIEKQDQYESFLFVADLHGLTTQPPADELRSNVYKIAAAWLASGLDPEKTVLWRQSDVKEVLELSYVLTCVTGMGLMERAHSYKDAKAKSKNLKVGLFYYPILMAADILLYGAEYVPVGKDQAQHLEMARDMATFYNEIYSSDSLKLPQAIIEDRVAVVPGIDGRKMSKSYDNGIEIFTSASKLKKQVMKIVTDSKGLEEPKNPDECIPYNLFKLISTDSAAVSNMADKLKIGGYGYGDAKKQLLQEILERFGSMRDEFNSWLQRPKDLEDVLQQGASRARQRAIELIEKIRTETGIGPA